MIVTGLIAGSTSMVQMVKVWAEEVLRKIAGWDEIPVDTTPGRIMKEVSQGDVVEMTGGDTSVQGAGMEAHDTVWQEAQERSGCSVD